MLSRSISLMCCSLVFSMGCASLPFTENKPLPTKTSTDNAGECTVEFQAVGGKNTVKTIPLQTDTTVDQVLERSGGKKFFGRMNIELVRKLPTGAWHKMGIEFERGKRRVEPTHDYHMLPGDRLVVKEDPKTFLDDIVEATTATTGLNLGPKK